MRHTDALMLAVGVRGLSQDFGFDPVEFAQQAIIEHATNFAGRAAIDMLKRGYCPICFVNRAITRDGKNPGVTVDTWVDNAAEEAAHERARLMEQPGLTPRVVH